MLTDALHPGGLRHELGGATRGVAGVRALVRTHVDEAHRHSLPVTAHTHGRAAVTAAVDAGVDGLEHATFPPEDTLVRTIADRHITVGLTLGHALPHDNARPLYEAGATITAGTDAGTGPHQPPDVLRRAVAELTTIGMTPTEALRASTSRGAAVCGLGHRKGHLAPAPTPTSSRYTATHSPTPLYCTESAPSTPAAPG